MIGDWVSRATRSGRKSKWHYVESEVAEALITRCGRRLEPVNAHGQELAAVQVKPLTRAIGQPQLCKLCDRGE